MSTGAADPPHWSAVRVVLTGTELDVLERTLVREEGAEPPGPPDGASSRDLEDVVRSLRVRGVLDEDGRLGDDLLGVWLGVALAARLAPRLVLRVVRVVAGPDDDGRAAQGREDPHARHGDRLVHLTDGVACVEDALPDGAQLSLAEPAQVVTEAVALGVPEDAAEGTGTAFTHTLEGLTRPAGALADALGRPTSLLRLEADVPPHAADVPPHGRGPATPSCHLVALGPRGCWVADLPPGRREPVAEFRPVGPGWVEDWVRARVAPFAEQGTMSG